MTVQNGDCIRTTAVLMGGDAQKICNVWYHKANLSTAESDATVMQGIRDHLEDNCYTGINTFIDNAISYIEMQFYNMTQDKPMGSLLWDDLTIGGETGADGMPSGVAACITGTTGTKNVKPKKFMGVFTETGAANGEWANNVLLELADTAAGWLQKAVVIYGDMWPGTWSKVLTVFVPLVSAVVRSVCAYQRRRKAGVGA